jgi:hypothetical protein
MPESRRIVRVFLASPGDLVEERKTAKAAVEEINVLYAHDLGYQIELVGWEDTVASVGRPQALINRDLERCELFVGMMFRRWGTPPDTTSHYSSGFEEEFRTSFERKQAGGVPEMSMLFKTVGEEFLKDPGEDLQKVLRFKDELISGKQVYFEHFGDLPDFAFKFKRCVAAHVRQVRDREGAQTWQNAAWVTKMRTFAMRPFWRSGKEVARSRSRRPERFWLRSSRRESAFCLRFPHQRGWSSSRGFDSISWVR